MTSLCPGVSNQRISMAPKVEWRYYMYKNYMGNPKPPETETDKATAEPEAEAAEFFEFS